MFWPDSGSKIPQLNTILRIAVSYFIFLNKKEGSFTLSKPPIHKFLLPKRSPSTLLLRMCNAAIQYRKPDPGMAAEACGLKSSARRALLVPGGMHTLGLLFIVDPAWLLV